jgi:hypothetical protein
MARHVATMSSQIVPLSNKTTINDNKTASSTMVITICVIDMIYDNIDGWLLFGHKNSRRHGCGVLVVSFLLTPMRMGVVVLAVWVLLYWLYPGFHAY